MLSSGPHFRSLLIGIGALRGYFLLVWSPRTLQSSMQFEGSNASIRCSAHDIPSSSTMLLSCLTPRCQSSSQPRARVHVLLQVRVRPNFVSIWLPTHVANPIPHPIEPNPSQILSQPCVYQVPKPCLNPSRSPWSKHFAPCLAKTSRNEAGFHPVLQLCHPRFTSRRTQRHRHTAARFPVFWFLVHTEMGHFAFIKENLTPMGREGGRDLSLCFWD